MSNGLTAVVCQRPDSAPVFSFFTNVDVGSVQDPMGKTGLAHMLEHMAFKGTADIGTKDYAAEKVALAKVEEAYAAYQKSLEYEPGSKMAAREMLFIAEQARRLGGPKAQAFRRSSRRRPGPR